ncbi:hypothetical protein HMPREF1556_01491 [Porphyromonas sp. oral taxon 278 str. W7784]|nr:hypothetical protein HMPREF1556_01491 [Porphyromonas sp. oral taxon 278 str. W7784]
MYLRDYNKRGARMFPASYSDKRINGKTNGSVREVRLFPTPSPYSDAG